MKVRNCMGSYTLNPVSLSVKLTAFFFKFYHECYLFFSFLRIVKMSVKMKLSLKIILKVSFHYCLCKRGHLWNVGLLSYLIVEVMRSRNGLSVAVPIQCRKIFQICLSVKLTAFFLNSTMNVIFFFLS
jgi:hypothetical protein